MTRLTCIKLYLLDLWRSFFIRHAEPVPIDAGAIDRADLFGQLDKLTAQHEADRAERQREIDELSEQARGLEAALAEIRDRLATAEAKAFWAGMRGGEAVEKVRLAIAASAPSAVGEFVVWADVEIDMLMRSTLRGTSKRLAALRAARSRATGLRLARRDDAAITAAAMKLKASIPEVQSEELAGRTLSVGV